MIAMAFQVDNGRVIRRARSTWGALLAAPPPPKIAKLAPRGSG